VQRLGICECVDLQSLTQAADEKPQASLFGEGWDLRIKADVSVRSLHGLPFLEGLLGTMK
jgi:hypothetical protein